MTAAVRLAALAVITACAAPAAAAVTPPATPAPALPATVVLRIPAFAVRQQLAEPDARLSGGEFASPLRTREDRAALADAIARQRAAENVRWARGERGIDVPLRRARF